MNLCLIEVAYGVVVVVVVGSVLFRCLSQHTQKHKYICTSARHHSPFIWPIRTVYICVNVIFFHSHWVYRPQALATSPRSYRIKKNWVIKNRYCTIKPRYIPIYTFSLSCSFPHMPSHFRFHAFLTFNAGSNRTRLRSQHTHINTHTHLTVILIAFYNAQIKSWIPIAAALIAIAMHCPIILPRMHITTHYQTKKMQLQILKAMVVVLGAESKAQRGKKRWNEKDRTNAIHRACALAESRPQQFLFSGEEMESEWEKYAMR